MKFVMLIVYFSVLIAVGIYCRRHATSVHGFVLGGRNVGPWFSAFSFGTSYFSAVIFVGYAGQFGWKYGIAATWIGLGNAIIGALLAWAVLGRRTRVITQHFGAATMPQFFSARFESRSLKIGASVIIFVFLIPYTASLYNGLSRLFGMAFHIDYIACILIMSCLTAIYVTLGGYMATAINDFIQGLVMLVSIFAIVAAVLKTHGGFMAALASLSAVSDPAVSTMPGIFTSFFGPAPLSLLFVILLTSFGTWGLPQMVQKFYAIESEHSIQKGLVISTIFALVIAGGCYFLGGFGRLYSGQVDVAQNGFDSIVPTMIGTLSPFLIALAVILVLSASMTTLASLVLTSSSTIVVDFLKQTLTKNLEDKGQLMLIRVFVVVFIAISAIIATIQYKSQVTFIAQLMGISWGALAGSFLAPFLYGLYWKKVTKAACWVSFFTGSGMMVLNLLFRSSFPTLIQSPINTGVCVMLLNLILVPIVSSFTRKPNQSMVDEAFACYNINTQVPQKTALGQ